MHGSGRTVCSSLEPETATRAAARFVKNVEA